MFTFKALALILILFTSIFAGFYPFAKKVKEKKASNFFSLSEPFAAGIFLSVGLLHMLGDASSDFYDLHIEYPLAFLLAGITFLFLLLLDHVAREVYHKQHQSGDLFAILAIIILSIHGFLEGSALGLSNTNALVLMILIAIMAHKWAASFALAVQVNKSSLSFKVGLIGFSIFVIMTPLGIISGSLITSVLDANPFVEPVFTSLAAGTFIYLGTLHGLERATLVQKCCNIKGFTFMLIGFSIMAIVAIWS